MLILILMDFDIYGMLKFPHLGMTEIYPNS